MPERDADVVWERLREMAARVRQQMAERPVYPDDPVTQAEQVAWAEAALPLQVEAMQLVDAWWDEHGDDEIEG